MTKLWMSSVRRQRILTAFKAFRWLTHLAVALDLASEIFSFKKSAKSTPIES